MGEGYGMTIHQPSTQDQSELPQFRVPAEPAPSGILQIALRHRWLTIVPVVALTVLGAVIGLVRNPEYTASAQLNVGGPAVPSELISITSEGRAQLASTYSRFIDARDVVEPVASRLGLDSTEVAERLSASPIPESPIFRVEGESTSETGAVALINAATASLIDFIRRSNAQDGQGELVLRRFRQAVEKTSQAVTNRDQADARLERNPSSRDAARSLIRATAALEAARLRQATLLELYRQNQAGLVGGRVVQVLDPATDASSDRFFVLQVLLFVGLAGGLVIGVGLAHLRERALRRRAGSGLYS